MDATTASGRARLPLVRAVLIYRWVALAWMTVLAATGEPFRAPVLASAAIATAAAWTGWLTATGSPVGGVVLGVDLALCLGLTLVSGVVVNEGEVVLGRPFFATGYPFAAALLWGVARGPIAGAGAGAILAGGVVAARPLNGVGLDELAYASVQNLAGSVVNYVVAGGAVGLAARLLARSADDVERANEALLRERERAARLAERESLARRIHDSVLQSLALVHKKGRELAGRPTVDAAEVARLAEIAGRQEAELRRLILREPEDAPTGSASLRDALEAAAAATDGIAVSVGAVGPLWLPAATVSELADAVAHALANVAEHAAAARASVFAEQEGGTVVVAVRDDGAGFVYDEDALRASGRAGILRSMKGRVEDLGGTMSVRSTPGRGTEIEFRVPAEERR